MTATQTISKTSSKIDDQVKVVLSNDTLALIKSEPIESNENLDILLEGNNKSFNILGGNADVIQTLISTCYNAREAGIRIEIICDNGIITFE